MPNSDNTERLNILWAKALIDACLQQGIDHFFLAPGSRCTPLTIALSNSTSVRIVQHFDERGLGYAAVGYGRSSGRCASVVCTSGTAVANLLPAVIEASMDQIPLLLLTADRPPELREVGANQTIDQQKLFGSYVRWFFDLPCPTDEIDIRLIRSTVEYAVDQSAAGPVHLNCMYREPFGSWDDSGTIVRRAHRRPIRSKTRYRIGLHGGNTLVAVGNCRRDEALAARRLADRLKCPLLADVTSGLRGLSHDLQLIRDHPQADTVIHVGGRITSKRWLQFVDQAPPAHFVRLSSRPSRIDPRHRVTQNILGSVPSLCEGVVVDRPVDSSFVDTWTRNSEFALMASREILQRQSTITEPGIAQFIAKTLPVEHGLFLGNSMPIRDMDAFGRWSGNRHIRVGANRGASGIDGLIASACGFALGVEHSATGVIGDISCLHDLNSLAILASSQFPVIVVIVNNNGGGIFHFLPVAGNQPGFERFFGTPHGLTFRHAADMFQLDYHSPKTREEFESSYRDSLSIGRSALIEVQTHRQDNLTLHRAIEREIRDRTE